MRRRRKDPFDELLRSIAQLSMHEIPWADPPTDDGEPEDAPEMLRKRCLKILEIAYVAETRMRWLEKRWRVAKDLKLMNEDTIHRAIIEMVTDFMEEREWNSKETEKIREDAKNEIDAILAEIDGGIH